MITIIIFCIICHESPVFTYLFISLAAHNSDLVPLNMRIIWCQWRVFFFINYDNVPLGLSWLNKNPNLEYFHPCIKKSMDHWCLIKSRIRGAVFWMFYFWSLSWKSVWQREWQCSQINWRLSFFCFHNIDITFTDMSFVLTVPTVHCKDKIWSVS